MQRIPISTGAPYEVLVGQQLLEQAGTLIEHVVSFQKAVIVTDDKVAPLYLEKVLSSFSDQYHIEVFVLPNGESSKCETELFRLFSFLCEKGLTRTDLLIALGGGVVGDLCGFAASCYLRGIPFVQIPTTLLAQVDSSVGGKTAIDLPQGKNLVGTFYQPKLVLCDTDTLKTLEPADFAGGMAEVIKYGCIADRALFDTLHEPLTDERLVHIISRCIEIKAQVVAVDEHDTGLRMMLNFGHTIGHAVEKYHHYTDYTHGEAVAIGMVKILTLAAAAGYCPASFADEVEALCKLHHLPTVCDVPEEVLFAVCGLDKKNAGDTIRIILLKTIGEASIVPMKHDRFRDFLKGN